jgi:signal transduction histidine kinase
MKTRLLGLCALGLINPDLHMDEETLAVAEAVAHIASNTLNHHLTEDDLRRSSTLMRRTDRLRSLEIMAGGFAHEIRNPLTSIKTFVQLAPQRQQDPVFIRDFSQIAIEDIHRIEALLHEILDYASYMTPKLSDVDINELVASCLGFISSTASHRDIQVQTTLAPQLPLLSLDRQQIKQVILNLLLNALDAMPNGNGVIEVCSRLLPQAGHTSWVQLQVKDEGCGIAPNNLEHIFDPFFTTKHSNSAGEGAGLGLTTAHQIVREHGGTLLVESRLGQGSTFSVNLPAPERRTSVSAARE